MRTLHRRVVALTALGLALFCAAACGPAESEVQPQRPVSVLGLIRSDDAGPSADVTAPPPAIPKRDAKRDESLLPRKLLFANPDRRQPRVSPDGKWIAWLADAEGVANVYIAPISDASMATVLTHDKLRGVRSFWFLPSSAFIVYPQDKEGDENWHLHAVDLKTGIDADLTPIDGVRVTFEGISPKKPYEIVVGMNDRDRRYHDFYKIDARTKKRELLAQSDGFLGMEVDDDFRVRFAMKPNKDGSRDLLMRSKDGKSWEPFEKIPYEDTETTSFFGFDRDGKKAYFADSRTRNTSALVEIDMELKKTKVLLQDGEADINDIMRHPTDRHLQVAFATYDRLHTHVIDQKLASEFDELRKLGDGDVRILNRSLDDNFWMLSYTTSDAPIAYYLRDRKKKTTTFLWKSVKALETVKLSAMRPLKLKSRDGLELVSYLTVPAAATVDAQGIPEKPLPMVLLVHGGPWSRDEWGMDNVHQWLASRGYAVLSVNYRGSRGFGKDFVARADREWAGKMHDDLIDAVNWAVAAKIADKDRVAIMGASYGGYATLIGLTFTPDTFACGVDIVGPSNLQTLLESIPPYWEPEIEELTRRIGDHRTEDGRKFLLSRSPLSHAVAIKKPLLIGQGKNDPRVKQAESDRIVAAMTERHIPVTYVLYPDEGHGFARPQNKLSFFAVAEPFLAQCLGGSYQPIGDDFAGSSITIPQGKEEIPGVAEAIK